MELAFLSLEMPSSRRVVVIDDDVDVAETTAAALRALGHWVGVVTDPRQALSMVSAERPDIVFLDIGMPHIDGFQLATMLKSALPDLCVVAVTAYGEPHHRQLGRAAGFDAHLVKPVDLATLGSAIETLFTPRTPR